MGTLLELHERMSRIEAALAETGGEITPEVQALIDDWLQNGQIEVKAKLDAYAKLIRELKLRSQGRHEEYKRLKARAEADAYAARNLADRLKWFMETHGIKTIETTNFRITVAKDGGRQAVDIDEANVPPEYCKLVRMVDVEKIRQDLQRGIVLPFARLKPRGTHLLIR